MTIFKSSPTSNRQQQGQSPATPRWQYLRWQYFLNPLGLGLGVTLLAGCTWFSRPESNPTPTASPPVNSTASPTTSPNPTASPSPNPTASPTPGQTPAPGSSPSPSPGAAASPATDPVVAQIQSEVEKETLIAKQNPGLVSLKRYLEAQRATSLISGQFSADLKVIEPELPTETEDYRFVVQEVNRQRVVIEAIAKRPTIPSFTGVVYVVKTKVPISGACGTPGGSQTPPSPPTLNNQTLTCSGGALLTE